MPSSVIFSQQFAEVVRKLREQGIGDRDPLLRSRFQNAFNLVLGGSVAQRSAQINISLPNLDENLQADISKDNVIAVSAIYFASQLEELKLIAVAEKVCEQFMQQQVPITRGLGGQALYEFIKDAPNRLTEAERKGIYARTFGFAQGAVDEQMPNREFADLWIRFLSAVSVLNRELKATGVRQSLTAQQVFKNARDLAVNLSLHGYGMAHFAAVELQGLVRTVIKMLGYPEVLSAYGVNDIWQLVERVSGLYLGGSANGVRQRTLAQSGAAIIQWLAKRQPTLLAGAATDAAMKVFSEIELVAEVEKWLAVTGTDDTSIDKFSEVVSVPSQPTIPSLSLSALPDSMASFAQAPGAIQNAMQSLVGASPNGKA
jgi:hypothetical protein